MKDEESFKLMIIELNFGDSLYYFKSTIDER